MDDKWFVFYEQPWLYLHRSWTGFCVFKVRFEPVAGGARVAEAWANQGWLHRESDERLADDDGRHAVFDVLLLGALLDDQAGRRTEEEWDKYFEALQLVARNGKEGPGATGG